MSNRERYEKTAKSEETVDMEKTPKDEEYQDSEKLEELERQQRQRRRERMAAMRKEKRRQELLRRFSLLIAAGMIVLGLAVWGLVRLAAGHGREAGEDPGGAGQENRRAEQNEDPGEGNPTGENPGEGNSAGENPGERNPAGENPGEGDPAGEGNPAEGEPMEEEPGEGNPAGENPGEGNFAGDNPGEENPAEGEPMEEETGERNSAEKYPGKRNPIEENPTERNSPGGNPPQEDSGQEELPEAEPFDFAPHITESTVGFPEAGRGVYSTNGILIDVEKEEILACREPYQRINPASMTKVLTLLVAAEHVEDLQDTFTMTIEITDYAYLHDCSIAGFGVGEEVTVEELMYGTILPSGADAAMALAEYVAGSQEAFVEMMNQKLEQLGVSDSAHFTNCVGLYDENHYCTVYDMALILKAATDNELCRRVMSARRYTTMVTSKEQPEGISLSNLFLRRIEDKDTHGEVLCAKTGFVDQSGSCAASLAADYEGREYICVTTGSISSWACIYDHVEIYQAFLPAAQESMTPPQAAGH